VFSGDALVGPAVKPDGKTCALSFARQAMFTQAKGFQVLGAAPAFLRTAVSWGLAVDLPTTRRAVFFSGAKVHCPEFRIAL
jgi:hypothetical protein